jgi:hypothetical protein
MKTECTSRTIQFQALGSREVVADFGGGQVSSDAGALLLGEVNRASGIIESFAACFTDHRKADRIEHGVGQLIGQRVYALALGYEDLNDHEKLRQDPLLAALAGKIDPTGGDRRRPRDKGNPLAGKSTLNRLELTPEDATAQSRYQKIVYDGGKIDRFFMDLFLNAHERPPEEIVLDPDATDDPLHGEQEGRFFNGYYGHYCYLPLYIFSGDFLLCARLRPSNIDPSKGALEELQRIVGQIRQRWPKVRIIIRGDSGFCREELMAWCEKEENKVDYVLGLARNKRLVEEIAPLMKEAQEEHAQSKAAARRFKEFQYQTRKSWSRARRVIGKAEWLEKGANPRFIVTSLCEERWQARELYEKFYCARGEMENRIKEQQLDMFADRTSTGTMRANQLRLWLSSVAYVLVNELRRVGLKGTEMARAQVGTIRTKLLKIGAQIKVSVRRVWARLSSAYPLAELFEKIVNNIRAEYPMKT